MDVLTLHTVHMLCGLTDDVNNAGSVVIKHALECNLTKMHYVTD